MAAKRTRDYAAEYAQYHAKPTQKKERASRNTARRSAEAAGRVRKGDGKDIDHVNSNPRDNSPSNLRVRSRHANRSDHRRVY
jgi:hypothetical protein